MSDLKTLLGEAVSEETVAELQKLIEESKTTNDDKVQSLTEEIAKLKEDQSDLIKEAVEEAEEKHSCEIASLKESADKYGAYLQEKAEEYGATLIEKYESEISELNENADKYGAYLQEKAEEYGAFLINRAEAYGAFLQEKAEDYAVVKQEETLEESKKEIAQFKEDHLVEFEKLDEHNRMSQVFTNLKTLIESSGFSVDDSNTIEETTNKLRKEKRNTRKLNAELDEAKAQIKEFKINNLLAESKLPFTSKEKIVSKALLIECADDEELKSVVSTLVESTTDKKQTSDVKSILNENTNTDELYNSIIGGLV